MVPGHRLWASRSGCHVLGLVEDYNALCKQISQGQKLLAEMDIQIQKAPNPTGWELGTKVTLPAAEVPPGAVNAAWLRALGDRDTCP